MGYQTDFDGEFTITPTLTGEHAAYLRQFAETRRVKRNAARTEGRQDHLRVAAGLSVGVEGGYFVGSPEYRGQENGAPDIVDYNDPPLGQPGLWCQWVPNKSGTALVWDEGEKFYDYTEWLQYLLTPFLMPWGYVLNGTVTWQGEDSEDAGMIQVTNNAVQILDAVRSYVPRANETTTDDG